MCDTKKNNRINNNMAIETDDNMTCLVYLSNGPLKTGIPIVVTRFSMTEVRAMIVKRIILCKLGLDSTLDDRILCKLGLDSILDDRIQIKCIVACNASMQNSSYLNGQCFIRTKQYKWHGIWSYREGPGCGGDCSATIIWIKGTTCNFPDEIWQLVMSYL